MRLEFMLMTLFFAAAAAAAPRPLIPVVEGVNPYRMLGPGLAGVTGGNPALETGYLERSLLVQTLAKALGGEVRRLDWSGIPTDAAGMRRAVEDLEGQLRGARQAGRPVCLVTHSLGTVIGYLALSDLAAGGEGNRPWVRCFVTLSSPLGRPQVLLWLSQFHPGLALAALASRVDPPRALGAQRWINAYVPWDPLGGPVDAPGVDNRPLATPLQAPGLPDFIGAHTLPFRDPGLALDVATELATDRSTGLFTDPAGSSPTP
jgi:hypothetical protein